MATLNIKNFPNSLYRLLTARAKRERRSISQEVTRILAEALEKPEPLSILEMRGLGKEVWEGVEAGEFVERERRSWD
jgi:plasmid stability protein